MLAAVLAGVLVVLGGLWMWFRDSSFVAVKQVRIVGVSGPDVGQIERALRASALTMTTLDVNMGGLRTAVEPYPDVRSLSVSTQFPHTVVIRVTEQVPVAKVSDSGRMIAVSANGTLLHSLATSDGSLPTIILRVPPGGTYLTEPGARAALAVLAAAPYRLLAHISQASDSSANGVVITLRNGPEVYFGDTTELAAKWTAAVAVLGNSNSNGAQYIDVSDPQRPAAGAQVTPAAAAAASSSVASSSSASSTGG